MPQRNQMQSTFCVVAPVTRGTACEAINDLIIKCQTFDFTLSSVGFRGKRRTVIVVFSSVHKHVRN